VGALSRSELNVFNIRSKLKCLAVKVSSTEELHPERRETMLVKDIMQRKVITVSPETSILDVYRIMVNNKISSVPVVDREKVFLGLIHEMDLLARISVLKDKLPSVKKPGNNRAVSVNYLEFIKEQKKLYGKTAKDIMNDEVVTINEEMDLLEIIELILKRKISRFPVVRRDKLAGFLSRFDVVRALKDMEEFKIRHSDDELTDEEITAEITTALKKNMGLNIVSIHVRTVNGHVSLKGQVGSSEDHRACEELARIVPGVRDVENNLVIDALLK